MTKNVAVRTWFTVFSLLVLLRLVSEILYAAGKSMRGWYHFNTSSFLVDVCGYAIIGCVFSVVVSRWWRSRKTATE